MVFTESPPQTSTSATVLVIDDEEADLQYWSDTVRNFPSNYTVLRAHDCRSGLAICRDRAVDCVLLDLDMPESGFKALLDLIPDRKRPEIAVIIFTRLVHPTLAEMAKHNGALAYLVKQHTSAEELDTAIQRAVSAIKSTLDH